MKGSREYDNNLKGFWLHFYLKGAGCEFIDYDLPIPNYLEHYGGSGGYAIGWKIEGYFNTVKGEKFLNDIIARFIITFADLSPQRLAYKPEYQKDDKHAHILNKAYSLKDFSKKLKSIKTKKYISKRSNNFDDLVFWAIKFHAEDLIKTYKIIPYELLESFALDQFRHKKSNSTLKAKCRNIFNYYDALDFKIPTKRKALLSRSENIIKMNKERAAQKENMILNLIASPGKDLLKKKNGKFNISKIAKSLNFSRDTVKKYLPKEDK